MDAKLLQRVMDLAEKTGDRVIVVNPKTGVAHAVVPFDDYEKMAQGTASLRDLDDSFDFDGASDIGRDDEDDSEDISRIHFEEAEEETESDGVKTDSDRLTSAQIEAIEKVAIEEVMAEKIAKESQKEAGGITPLDVLDDEANEEQYYLEPLE
jgi:hypothetical protein